MRKTMFLIVAAVALVPIVKAQSAQTKPKTIPIYLDCKAGGADRIGLRICTALTDDIALSPRYVESNLSPGVFVLHVGTMEVPEHPISAQSIVLTFAVGDGEYFVDLTQAITGSGEVKDAADKIMAAVDDDIQKFQGKGKMPSN